MVVGVAGGNTVCVDTKIKCVNMQIANKKINVVTLNVGYKWHSSSSLL